MASLVWVDALPVKAGDPLQARVWLRLEEPRTVSAIRVRLEGRVARLANAWVTLTRARMSSIRPRWMRIAPTAASTSPLRIAATISR